MIVIYRVLFIVSICFFFIQIACCDSGDSRIVIDNIIDYDNKKYIVNRCECPFTCEYMYQDIQGCPLDNHLIQPIHMPAWRRYITNIVVIGLLCWYTCAGFGLAYIIIILHRIYTNNADNHD